jgi:hypothetical protein
MTIFLGYFNAKVGVDDIFDTEIEVRNEVDSVSLQSLAQTFVRNYEALRGITYLHRNV